MFKMIKQTSSFDEHSEQHRARRLAGYLREHHDDLVGSLSDEDLVRHVRYGIRRASAYDIDVDRSLTMFLLLMLRTSQTFDEYPSIQRLLTDERVQPNLRIYEVLYKATHEDWNQVMIREQTRWN
jgi:hypothetical protein